MCVVPTEARCGGRDRVEVWSAHAFGARTIDARAPNTVLQLTASRARSLGFWHARCGALAAAEHQAVRRVFESNLLFDSLQSPLYKSY